MGDSQAALFAQRCFDPGEAKVTFGTGSSILVNIGHETTNVNILDEGVPVLTRDISIGTRRFREDLQRERNMSADEADQLLRGFERNEALEPLLASRGEELAVGIERAAAFLQSSSRSASGLSRIFTSGGGSRIPGLYRILADRLRLPVQTAIPLERLQGVDLVAYIRFASVYRQFESIEEFKRELEQLAKEGIR
jgi:Tfp pilus assembly PilM family ATPase